MSVPPSRRARGARPEEPAAPADVGHLRIAILSDAIPGRNGVGTYYDDLVPHLRKHVRAVSLLSPPEDPGASGPRIPMPGDPTQTLRVPAVRRIWAELSELSPHVVVAATPGPYGVLGWVKAARLGVPFCVAHHTEFSKLADLYWDGWFGRAYRWGLVRWSGAMMRRGAVVLVHNDELVETARGRGARKVELVGTPIPRAFLEAPLRPLAPTPATVSFVGRLAPEKELGQVLEAAAAHPDLRFRIVGEGPLRDEVERRARERPNLDFLGWVDRGEVLELLDTTDLLVLPSRYETFGSVALEAMVRRRPALVSRACGITRWDDLAPGLFQMLDGESLSDAILRVHSLPPDERRAVAERGHAAAHRLNDRTVAHWLGAVEGVAGRREAEG